MTKVSTGASMSLDGYIAGPGQTGFDQLFRWNSNGDVAVPTLDPDMTLRMSAASAEHWRSLVEGTGAMVVGRTLVDFTAGWGGCHPMGKPVVVLSQSVSEGWPREDAPFTFVTDGIASAVEQARTLAGGKAVGVNGGSMARQCLQAGLLDEIWVDLVPVLLGGGTPSFGQLEGAPVELDGPVSIVPGTGVTHLRYRVGTA